jgi:hypothetical protein
VVKEVRLVTSEKIIVLVCDKGDSKHGEISVLDDPQKAERLVETLLEAGFEEERIRVFSGKASEFQISQRPVVALVNEREEKEPQPAVDSPRRAARVDSPVAEEPAAEEPVTVAGDAGAGAEEEADAGTEEEKQPSGAQVTAPVRFSSLFRSA